MRIARFVIDKTDGNDENPGSTRPAYAFVQKDEGDSHDYLVEVAGYPLSSQQVQLTGKRYPLDGEGVRLLAPVLPSKIYGVMKNHRAQGDTARHDPHEMLIFSKPSTAVAGPDDPIRWPDWAGQIHYEAELAVIIGRPGRNIPVEKALDHVLGYTATNDVTAYDVQGADPFLTRSKGFDTACPLGPWIQTELNPDDARIEFLLNGQKQEKACGSTKELIYSVAEQISYISTFATLLPGDVILTGCMDPTGVLHDRDEAEVRIEGLGSLHNVVLKG